MKKVSIVMDPVKLRKDLVSAGRSIVRAGLVVASGGNISARIGSTMFIKSRGSRLDSSDPDEYVAVDVGTLKQISGLGKYEPSSEKLMHQACYAVRKDINAVLHLHPVFSTAVSNSKVKAGPITYELAACLGSHMIKAKYKPSGSKALAMEIRRLIKAHNAILMPNHGILVVGDNIGKAAERAKAVERACQILVFSRLLGVYKFLPKKEADRIISIYR
jgi:L-fuculose-phosphate aldolase